MHDRSTRARSPVGGISLLWANFIIGPVSTRRSGNSPNTFKEHVLHKIVYLPRATALRDSLVVKQVAVALKWCTAGIRWPAFQGRHWITFLSLDNVFSTSCFESEIDFLFGRVLIMVISMPKSLHFCSDTISASYTLTEHS